jgi:ADP-ribose pyrophosphatase YjhB (NUDIX family)
VSPKSPSDLEKAVRGAFRYCPHCAAPLAEGEKFGRTRRFCRYCGFIHFAEPKVAVAAVVSDGKRILLVRRAAIPRIGYWALPAGYMDGDELPEEALVREVGEETGVTVRVLGLQGIAPLAGWQERRGILVLYRAEPLNGNMQADADATAGDDVSEARWFARDEVPWNELAFESTLEYVAKWAKV